MFLLLFFKYIIDYYYYFIFIFIFFGQVA